MDKKQIVGALLGFLSLSLVLSNSYGESIEGDFKNICGSLAEYSQKTILPAGGEQELSVGQPRAKNNEPALLRNWKDQLKEVIRENPSGEWADDAQFIIATVLTVTKPEQQISELENLLKSYPNAKIEPWTEQVLPWYMPDIPVDMNIRMQLCFLYDEFGYQEKLEGLCAESIQRYPDKAAIFQKLLR